MTKKRKIIVLSCMIALLAVTAVFNFIWTTEATKGNDESTIVSSSNYFTQYRTERMSTRNEEMLQLDSIIASASAESIERAEALSMKIDLTEMTETEMLLENLIKAYGFDDAVVVMGLESGSVNVITKAEELSTDDAIKICTIVAEETGISSENVKIIPIS